MVTACKKFWSLLAHRFLFFFSSRRRHTRLQGDWSSDVCSSDLEANTILKPSFHLTQNTHDVLVLEMIKQKGFFGCGLIVPKREDDTLESAKSASTISHYRVYSESDLVIIPFLINTLY